MSDKEPCSLESPVKVEETLLQYNKFSTEERLKECFKPTCHVRRLKNKGAMLVLVWNFLVTGVHIYIVHHISEVYSRLVLQVMRIIFWVTLPLAGWLADVRYGRYKVMRLSIWTMWISSMLLTASIVIEQIVESYESIHHVLLLALFIFLGIGNGGFQANVIQFGVDQLHDSSTTEITSFVTWYAWTFFTGRMTVDFTLACMNKENKLFGPLIITVYLSAVIISIFLFNNLLIKEPVTQNPFKLIYKVVKYAIKNKYPRQRSAFTYCEDNLPSRIDFGKRKYGGPFTTEQVEDVKTFFQALAIILIGSAVFGMTNIELSLKSKIYSVFTKKVTDRESVSNFVRDYFYTGSYYITGAIIIPLHEIFIYPLLNQCCISYLSIYSRFVLGILLHSLKCTILMVLITYARHYYIETSGSSINATIQCLFHESPGSMSSSLDYRWFAVPECIYTISDLLIMISCIEFFCAQVPYSMKGFVAGITFAGIGVFVVFAYVISLPFKKKSSNWETGTISCEFWYLITKLLFLTLVTIISCIVKKCYKNRKREDVLPNEQIFAERYYSTIN